MVTLKIDVKNKIAKSINDCIVCGNSDYIIEFAFDEEWQLYNIKTARFKYNNTVTDVIFEGNTVAVPVITNSTTLKVGVFAGDLHTTTPALISCNKSILCENGLPPDPAPDVYAQIIQMLEKAGSIDPEAAAKAVSEHLKENPLAVPVQSVNGKTGEVNITADDILTESDTTEIAEKAAAIVDTNLLTAIGAGVIE